MRCAIWYHLYHLKTVKNTHGGVLILVMLQGSLNPPLFHGNEYVTDLKKKAKLLNSFFNKQCCLVNNSTELPLNLHYTTKKRLETLNFSSNDNEKTMQNLNPNKAHDHNKISFRMI